MLHVKVASHFFRQSSKVTLSNKKILQASPYHLPSDCFVGNLHKNWQAVNKKGLKRKTTTLGRTQWPYKQNDICLARFRLAMVATCQHVPQASKRFYQDSYIWWGRTPVGLNKDRCPGASKNHQKTPAFPERISVGEWLGGGWTNPIEKYARQNGNLLQFSGW